MNANDANDGIVEPGAAAVVNDEATSLSSSQPTATASAEYAEDSIATTMRTTGAGTCTCPDEDTLLDEEGEFLYENLDQEVPMNARSVKVGKNIPYIKKKAFAGRYRLEKVDMSGALSLKTIGIRAFDGCTALSIIKWAPNVKTIGNYAFSKCTSLREIDMSKFHDALETIGEWAFAGCSALSIIKNWPPNLKIIGNYAFYQCTNLKKADMSKLHALEIIGTDAFRECSSLSTVKWAPNLKTIRKSAFSDCLSLNEADMSKLHALETIGEWAFAFCGALTLFIWAPNLKTIGDYAFFRCKSLTESDMSELLLLESVGEWAFAWCNALALFKWPPNLKTIGFRVFRCSANLQNVIIPSKHHWFVRDLSSFDETHELLSVDVQGHDLKMAIRVKNVYPQATPGLTMNRLVSMYAKSPLTAAQLEDAAQGDESVSEEDWEATRSEDLQRLGEIQKAHADSMYKLLHWCAGNNLAGNLAVREIKRENDDS